MAYQQIGDFGAYLGGLIVILYVIFAACLGQYHQKRFLLELAAQHYIPLLEEGTARG